MPPHPTPTPPPPLRPLPLTPARPAAARPPQVPRLGPGEDYDVEVPSLPRIMRQFEPYGGLAVNWRFFGTSGHGSRPRLSAPESYTKCFPAQQPVHRHVKVIGNLAHVVSASRENPHSLEYPPGSAAYTVDELFRRVEGHETREAPRYAKLALHHYVTKSAAEYQAKVARGAADGVHKSSDWLRIIDVQCAEDCVDAVALARACRMDARLRGRLIPAMRDW
jgi:hypothetical protein